MRGLVCGADAGVDAEVDANVYAKVKVDPEVGADAYAVVAVEFRIKADEEARGTQTGAEGFKLIVYYRGHKIWNAEVRARRWCHSLGEK
jgi:hypothetical protein